MFESTVETTPTSARLIVSGELSFETALEARDALVDLVSNDAPVLEVDVGEVQTFDLAGVQLLYSAVHSAKSAEKVLSVSLGALAPRIEKLCAFAGLPRDELSSGV